MKELLLAMLVLSGAVQALGAAVDPVTSLITELPIQSELHAASNAAAATWVTEMRGERAIWIAEGEPLRPRELHKYSGDDGIPLSQLTISPDGAWVAYIRGSSPNAQGEINNPRNLADPQERALWLLATKDGSAPRRVDGGTTPAIQSPVFSPDGRTLAFARGRDVWFVDLATAASPRRAFTIRGGAGSLAWSPDGKALAFMSNRNAHAFVGVFTLADRSIRYLAPGIDQDMQPSWSADGRWLAFVRFREELQSYRFTARLEGIPWSIMLADTRSWEVRTLWTADTGRGSSLNEAALFAWAADRIVFGWEKTGWQQLYSITPRGGPPTALTQGQGEVLQIAVGDQGKTVYYLANSQLRERFDLYRVASAGGASTAIFSGVTHAISPVTLADGRVVFDGYTQTQPSQLMIAGAEHRARALVPNALPATFPLSQLVTPEIVEIEASDGLGSRALLYKPRGMRASDRRPAVVYVHGGSRSIETVRPGRHAAGIVEALVMNGYVVILPNYRSGIGYGLEFREVAGYGGSGGTDTLDAVAAGEYLARLPGVDGSKLGIFGISYGGYLTTAALARAPRLWAAGVSIVGVADWQMELELDAGGARLPYRLSQRMKYEDLAFDSSANAHLDDWRAPLLFLSGDDDQQGWLVQAIQLGQSLRRRGVPVEAVVEPGGTHGPATMADHLDRVRNSLRFFDKHLRGLPPELVR
jgi:dipeptidyl aminopeptidase/acylaminoacyl peptidase